MSFINLTGIDRLAQLNALHLYGMATAWSELLAEGPRRPVQPEAWLDRLIDAELAYRQVRSLRYQIKAARFPVHRDLTGIDWAETPLPQAQIQQLASAAFMETAHNLILERDRLKSTRSSYILPSNFIALLIAARFNLKRYCSSGRNRNRQNPSGHGFGRCRHPSGKTRSLL